MLTKDLILCSSGRGGLRPRFIVPDDPRLRLAAERLLELFRQTPPPTRSEIAERAGEIAAGGGRDMKILRGLIKLLLDRSDFGHDDSRDFPALRQKILRRAAGLLRAGKVEGLQRYRQAVFEDLAAENSTPDNTDLYADLPEHERLLRFRDLGARELLERYNVGLVQGLLLRAERLTARVGSPEPARMRRLFRYLKFFRLLVRVTIISGKTGEQPIQAAGTPRQVQLVVDGPTSLFDQPRRYGLQLASFFPALCTLEEWELDTVLEWKGKKQRLRLNQNAGLVSHYRHFGAYVPEEIRLFEQHFRKSVQHWRITEARPFLRIRGQDLAFPDFAFQDSEGRVLHLELFHRWHAGPLRERLQALAQAPDLPLVLGIDRALASDAIEAQLEESGLSGQRAFRFRDYPTVPKTVRCLDAAAETIWQRGNA